MTTSKKKTTGPKSGAANKTANKAAPGKKRPRKKKKGVLLRGVLSAFLAGVLITAIAVWFLRDAEFTFTLSPESRQGELQAAQKNQTARQSQAPEAAPRQTTAASRKKAAPPEAPPHKEAASQTARPGATEKKKAPDSEATHSAVTSALIDLQNLPYEESLAASLDERIRQVDYALMQAAWMQRLPARSMRLVSVEDRLEGVEPYQFQVIDILPGKSAEPLKKSLRECLAAWADGADLAESDQDNWAVSVNGIQTHSLRLYPGRSDFPPPPEQKTPEAERPAAVPSAPRAPQEGMTTPRLRSAGEAPRLVIVIDDLGANHDALKKLLALDYPVTCAFWPHGEHTREGAELAHSRGREVIVHLPMEPMGYPKVRPGPDVLLTGMGEPRIRRIVESGIAAVPYATGLNNHMGSRFTQHRAGVDAVIGVLKARGLFMLDSLTHARSVFASEGRRLGLTNYRRNVFLDTAHSRSEVLKALRRAERIAQLSGQAVAIGHPLPETLEALNEWQRIRDKHVNIVPLRDLKQE
ncbi:MAG: divergent polysaccharide deacetylase family protein [Desulfovibrio sp.]|jgi:polysaccharide deacetylase 2 family uncharacterized protein YibQ|nr:divergent polysaccharide deacetylase family protein [Desulfovibrio sp.]